MCFSDFEEKGIKWPVAIAPFQIEIITVNHAEPSIRKTAEEIYAKLSGGGWEVLYDDRDERAGVKFNDAELIGVPFQIIIGERNLQAGKVEIKDRNTGQSRLVDLKSLEDEIRSVPKPEVSVPA